jgi:hypothetical protein
MKRCNKALLTVTLTKQPNDELESSDIYSVIEEMDDAANRMGWSFKRESIFDKGLCEQKDDPTLDDPTSIPGNENIIEQ